MQLTLMSQTRKYSLAKQSIMMRKLAQLCSLAIKTDIRTKTGRFNDYKLFVVPNRVKLKAKFVLF